MPRTPKAFIIEDALDSALLLRKILKLSGYEVDTAADGTSALAKVKCDRRDVFFCDLSLPDMDGIQLVGELRVTPGLENSIFVAVSGHTAKEDRDAAIAAGFHHYITKPFDVRDMRRFAEGIASQLPLND